MTSRRHIIALLQLILTGSLILISVVVLWKKTSSGVSLHTAQTSGVETYTIGNSSLACITFEKYLEGPQSDSEFICTVGYVPKRGQKSCTGCPKGKFSLPNWIACEPLLGCDHLRHEVSIGDVIYGLVQWRYFAADWKGYEVLYARFNPLAKTAVDYFSLQLFSPSQYFIYPIGYCKEDRTFLFAPNTTFVGIANHLDQVFSRDPACNTCKVKFNLILGYLHILSRLHANNAVLCNSRTLDNLVSQFLITEEFNLVLATLDNLQSDANGTVLCHQSEQAGDFVAPEQRWPYGSVKIFNPKEQPGSDKKSDIWKVPDMVTFVLTDSCALVSDYLQATHLLCKSSDPQARPTADQLLVEYKSVQKLLFEST